ncbi:methyltransferase domain-containing protein [Aneurinibacillus sp. Ricciae_BoGa-3]|uniref:class I SAM-dependent DNA methyltransferase n=1 Tax=Aneurinibacillus sp. Ricciae_BoGa-3 TaxID=3022697 RepID=UPI0023407271|nr:class I SAM-dependent methyltransferase [Aneurinibacillus sp. Ricciae_BoGa-3]WCK53516.1 methyltransferase domain-containing protein [Aneurinibacillus sp. Ricciae_BoGa-3]
MHEQSASSNYHQLARVYDHLMADAPYAEWMQFVLQAWQRTGQKPDHVAELGCGTGSLTRYLLEAGLEVWAVDLSADMLEVAREKIQVSHPGARVHLLQQDITGLDLGTRMDSVVSFCDTLNYITECEGIRAVFNRVFQSLVPGGTFLFDVHTPYKIRDVFGDESFHYQDEEVAYIWESSFYEETETVKHDLTLFVRENDGLFRRFQESHLQQSYNLDDLAQWLVDEGFEVITVTSDFSAEPVAADSERAFFIARKPGSGSAG